ncbi:MAG: hypothetical protein HY865_00875 [Chloroflexi bacterium]|nr:hypothetical protein [Chloroflexota bacterium]
MKPYSALTAEQRAQVAYLFADEAFGTDASAYLYEVDKGGAVTRRKPDTEKQSPLSTARTTSINVKAVRDEHVTAAQVETATMHMDALAAFIAEKIYQPTFEEVTNS